MKKLLYAFTILILVSCSPKLFTIYEENGKNQEKINLAKLNEYISKKRIPGFEISSPWSSANDSTGNYIFTSKNGKITISAVKKDGEFTFLKKIVKLDHTTIVYNYLSNGILEKRDTIIRTEIDQHPQINVSIQNQVPNIILKDRMGNETSLADFNGKYIYIYVWATWSTPSKTEIVELNKIIRQYKEKDIAFIAIALALNSKTADQEWQQFINDKALNGIQLFCSEGWESQFTNEYKVYHVPRSILINSKGEVIEAFAPLPSDSNLKSTLDSLFSSANEVSLKNHNQNIPSGNEFSPKLKSNNILIDTVEFHFNLKGIADITSFVPQINSGINRVVQKKINDDLKTYFQASSITQDSIAYIKALLKEFNLENLENYLEVQEDLKMDNPFYKVSNPYYFGDELEEDFKIEYISENLLNIGIYNQILPYRGQYQFYFESIHYDLRTGNKLSFDDYFSVSKEALSHRLQEDGYWFEWDNETQRIEKRPFGVYHEEYIIDDFAFGKEACNDFYFNTLGNEIYLMIKLKCVGKYLMDYGISLEKLEPHIEYFEFKNLFQLWGKTANSLIGQDYSKIGNEIVFEDYSIKHIGSHLLPKDNFDTDFGIAEYWSAEKRFLLFYEIADSKKIVTDILEINKKDIKNRKLTEYCSTKNGFDSEIIAIVKDNDTEFHSNIIKAWRANRESGKFEKVSNRKISKCGNENYGI